MKQLFRKGRYANVTATIALIAALGGTSYAAVTLPPNSVGTKQIKKGGVTASDIRTGAVRSRAVKDGSLLGKDFAPGQLPAGPAGPKGATGATGPAGPAGAAGASATKLFASVSSAGGLTAGQSSGALTATRSSLGTYQVRFNRDIRACSYLATIGLPGFTGTEPTGEITTVGENASATGVFINTFTSAGAAADHGFYLAVFCP